MLILSYLISIILFIVGVVLVLKELHARDNKKNKKQNQSMKASIENLLYFDENKLLKRYIDLGVDINMIKGISHTSCFLWSLTRKRMVGGIGQPQALELIEDLNGYQLTYENNRMMSLIVRTKPNVLQINNSNGIIIAYHCDYFRYDFIPNN